MRLSWDPLAVIFSMGQNLAGYKTPKISLLADALPRTYPWSLITKSPWHHCPAHFWWRYFLLLFQYVSVLLELTLLLESSFFGQSGKYPPVSLVSLAKTCWSNPSKIHIKIHIKIHQNALKSLEHPHFLWWNPPIFGEKKTQNASPRKSRPMTWQSQIFSATRKVEGGYELRTYCIIYKDII